MTALPSTSSEPTIERLQELAIDWHWSDEFVGIYARRLWPRDWTIKDASKPEPQNLGGEKQT